jgi:HK97 family phage portal protein
MFGWKRKAEARAAVVPVSDSAEMLRIFNLGTTSASEPVTVETALSVPAISGAVNFLSRTLASLPVDVYQVDAEGKKEPVGGDLVGLLNEAVNSETSSFDWRKYSFDQTFTGGRQFSFIDRNAMGRVIAIWPLDPLLVTVERFSGVTRYKYRENSRSVTYEAGDVIDLAFSLKSDNLTHRSPIQSNAEVVSMAIAATKFGGAHFRGGGVPPFAIKGNFQAPGAMERAAEDLEQAVRRAARENRQALVLPAGLDIVPIGQDAQKAQLIETQRFLVEQIARIYGLPPVFLQDLTHGTFSNTEQQDLHLVKHCLRAWVKQWEDQINLKLFGWRNRRVFVKMNMDGLLRGDFKTRMDGYAQGVQHGLLTPNEGRALEGRPRVDGGDQLFMQGAMLPIEQLGAGNGGGNGD